MKRTAWFLALGVGLLTASSIFAATDFPARTFFNARGVMETPFGKFVTGRPGVAGRSDYCPIRNPSVSSLPPYGSTYGAELAPTLLYSVSDPSGPAVAKILKIQHVVDGTLQTATDFPPAGIDTFKSTFINGEVEILVGPLAGKTFFLPTMIDAAQGVSRSAPFYDGGPGANDHSVLPLPPGSQLPGTVSDSDIDFFVSDMNGTRQKSIHLEIISLDARSADGQYRIISGQQMLAEYPQLFIPSFGIVVSNSTATASASK